MPQLLGLGDNLQAAQVLGHGRHVLADFNHVIDMALRVGAEWDSPVSYTHLDVYKKQLMHVAVCLNGCQSRASGGFFCSEYLA